MNTRRFFMGKAIGFIVVVVLVGGFFLVNNYIYREKQGDGKAVELYRTSLLGEYVCVPYKDVSKPQTDECVFGLKTDVGEYYGIDFFLMSQTHDPLVIGQRISANGVVIPVEQLSPDKWQEYPVEGTFSVTDSLVILGEEDTPQITVALGDSATAMHVTVSPQRVISDSRCPSGVQCIWAGTVEVWTVLTTEVAHGEHTMTLGEPQVFGDYLVTLIEVSPAKTQESIPDDSYQLTYTISLK